MKTLLVRQGDVMLIPVRKELANTYKIESRIIAYGESSGHCHVILGDCGLVGKDLKMYVVTHEGKSYLAHLNEPDKTAADHQPLELEPNTTYQVRHQRQYDPYKYMMEYLED